MIIHIVFKCEPGRFTGGVSKMVLELAAAQAKFSPVEIWAVDNNKKEDLVYRDLLTVRYFPGQQLFGVVESRALIDELTHLRSTITVLHGHNTFHPLNRQINAVSRKLDIPAFYNPHGALDPTLSKGFGFRQLKKKIYTSFLEVPVLNQARGVFALTPLEEKQLLAISVKSKIHVVPNGIEPVDQAEETISFREQIDISSSAKVVLYMGRITEKKGLTTAIQAFKLLTDRIDDLYFLIAGDPNEEPAYTQKLKQLVGSLNVTKKVKWIGFVDERSKASVFRVADAFVHTSFSEGMAMSILEAMIQGVPVVATEGCYMFAAAKAGGLLEVPNIPSKVSDSLYEVLTKRSVAQTIVSNAREYIVMHHQWSQIAKRMIAIYKG